MKNNSNQKNKKIKTPIKDIKCFGTSTMGKRGQIVIPAEMRRELNLKSGQKFIVLLHGFGSIMLVPSNKFEEMIGDFEKKIDELKKQKNKNK